MTTTLRTSVVFSVLLGMGVPAKAGHFSTYDASVQGTIQFATNGVGAPVLPNGVDLTANYSTANTPPGTDNQTGTGVATGTGFSTTIVKSPEQWLIGTQLNPGSATGSVDLPVGTSAAAAGGSSDGLKFTNSTNASITISIPISYSVTLKTTYGGYGDVSAQDNLYLVDQGGMQVVYSHKLVDTTGDLSTTGSGHFNITIAANSSDTAYLKGNVMGAAAVPEPTSMILLSAGIIGVLGYIRLRRRSSAQSA